MQRIIKDLTTAIGYGQAIDLCRRWGGRELRIPVKVDALDPLALSLGLETAQRLVAAFGDQRLQLPSEKNALLDMRNDAIVADRAAGLSHESIGLRYGLTRQAIAHILKARDADDPRAEAQAFAGARQQAQA